MKGFFSGFRKKKNPYHAEGIDGYDWDEAQPKWPLSRILEVGLGVGSVIVWVIILFRIFSSGNGDFENMILLNKEAAKYYPEPNEQVLRIHSDIDENAEGDVIISYPVYLPEADNLQLTARVNGRTLPAGKGEMGYTFVLRESDGKESTCYELSYHKEKKQLQYYFFRLCFEKVEFDEDKTYTLLVYKGSYEPKGGEYSSAKADFTFVVYHSETYTKTITPKDSVYEVLK